MSKHHLGIRDFMLDFITLMFNLNQSSTCRDKTVIQAIDILVDNKVDINGHK